MKLLGQILYLIGTERHRVLVVLLVFMIFGMVLETVGVGLFIPALVIMTEPNVAGKYPPLAPFLAQYGLLEPGRLIVAGLGLLTAVYLIKNLYLGFVGWWQARFIFDVQARLSQRLFEGYLRHPYAFHLQRNSAELVQNTIGEVQQFTLRTITPLMVLATEGLVLVGISALLLLVEPAGAIVVIAMLGLAGYLFYRAFRRRLLDWGTARQHHDSQRLKHLQQGLGGAKDVILLGREEDFLGAYRAHNEGSADFSRKEYVLQLIPRLFFETLAVAGLALLVIVMIAQGRSVQSLIPTLGLFTAAAFRLMPLASRVLGSIQRMRFALPVVGILHRELVQMQHLAKPAKVAPMPFEKALKLVDVSFAYPEVPRVALHGVSLSVQKGTSVGFVGESGAGKSTLVDVILGLLTPTSGAVLVDGADVGKNLRGWQMQAGYVPQSIFLTDDSLRRNIAFGLAEDEIDEDAVDAAIEAAQLKDYVAELAEGKNSIVGERGIRLSGGQRQRIGIARALYHNPQLLVLDEATSALDAATENSVMKAIEALHGTKTIIVIAHRLSTVRHCDHLFKLEQGRIVDQGSFADIAGARSA